MMSSPLHLFLQDMIQAKTAELGADKLHVRMAEDNATAHRQCAKSKRRSGKHTRKHSLDISDHTKGMSRWEAGAR
ncbi:unnamed protein product [Cylindrotheca closterium]|uniref:Uncharacterized protein n=1 Tax=Cylindrotheca closterium TaxID=2856 RepID=A0AAD2G3U3_9STRA|nr:unnamed protein product [Cylindrotheca closterium]